MKKILSIIILCALSLTCGAQKIAFDYDFFNDHIDEDYTDPSDGKRYVYIDMPIKVYGYKGQRLYACWHFSEYGSDKKMRGLPGSILAPEKLKENGLLRSKQLYMDIPNNKDAYKSYNLRYKILRDYFPRYSFAEFSGPGHVLMELIITNGSGKEIARSKCFGLWNRLNGDKTTLTKYLNDDWAHPNLEREESDGIVYHEQRNKCWSCGGHNNCSVCGGLGTKRVGSYRESYRINCVVCGGSGKCNKCNGGYITMTYKYYLNKDKAPAYVPTPSSDSSSESYDNTTRNQELNTLYRPCVSCGGGGTCKYCLNGYRTTTGARCSTCNGSGICNMCNGAGKKVYKTLK